LILIGLQYLRKEVIRMGKIKDYWWLLSKIGLIITTVVGFIWCVFSTYSDLNKKYDQILQTNRTTQQMALKSVIWNKEIPLDERASACDVYLNAGYNSMTKKECELIIERGAQEGIF